MPIDRESVLQTAQKYAEKKKYDRAIVEYQKIIQVDPNDARTLLKMGDLQVKMGAYADSVATYERVGKQYVTLGFFVKAVWVYKQIREIIQKHLPHLEDAYAHIAPKLAEIYQNLGLTSDALATLDEVATRLQKQQRDREAIDVFKQTIELDPNNPIPHLRLGEALSRARDPDAAAGVFGTAASMLIKRGRPDDALKVLERLLHHKPDPAQARIAAELYLQRGQPNDGLQALAKLQICFQANPKDLDTLELLARAFSVIGQAEKGIEVHKEMARIAREQGKDDLFRRLVEDLAETAPDDEQVQQLVASLEADSPHESLAAPVPQTSAPTIEAVELDEDLLDDDDSIMASLQAEEEEPSPFDVPNRLSSVSARGSIPDVSIPDVSSHEGSELQNFDRFSATDNFPEMMVEEAEDLLVPANEEAIAELLEEAASLRRRRMYTSAVESLRIGLELDPNALELRFALRDVLIEAGRIDDAVDETFATASLQLDKLDGEGAARSLSDILQIDPGNERALHMLSELGYETPLPSYANEYRDEDSPPPSSQPIPDAPAFSRHGLDAVPSPSRPPARGPIDAPPIDDLYDPDAPLPTYELDELGTGDVIAETLPRGRLVGLGGLGLEREGGDAPPPSAKLRELAIDDPFGSDVPLPEFPLEAQVPDVRRDAPPTLLGDTVETEVTSRHGVSARPVVELEDALEEADFFASRGLYGDARAVLREQLSRNPNHPLLHERIQELEHQEHGSTAQTSGTRAVPNNSDERSFDISASLDALENLEEVTGPIEVGHFGQVDVEEVFAKFKEGVGKQIDVDDADMHYDLGIAYKEIGKLDDAIRELALAARDGNRTCVCESMIGTIHMDRGDVTHAIDAFVRGLHADLRTPDQETMLSFELGNAYEQKSLWKDALGCYQRVGRWNPNYRDVGERIRRLSKIETTWTPTRAVAVGAEDDEFDRAFDEIIGDGKLP